MRPAIGLYTDTLTDLEGNVISVTSGRNQPQDDQTLITARLFSGTSIGMPLSYLAVGSGEPNWDITAPVLDPTDTSLLNETFRVPIASSSILFVDPVSEVESPTPTRAIRITVQLGLDITGDLREMALYGGDASSVLGSGLMFNWIVTPLLNKTSSQLLTRRIVLKWLTDEEATSAYCN